MNLRIDDTDNSLIKKIIQYEDENSKTQDNGVLGSGLRIPQISIDQSGLIMVLEFIYILTSPDQIVLYQQQIL